MGSGGCAASVLYARFDTAAPTSNPVAFTSPLKYPVVAPQLPSAAAEAGNKQRVVGKVPTICWRGKQQARGGSQATEGARGIPGALWGADDNRAGGDRQTFSNAVDLTSTSRQQQGAEPGVSSAPQ